MLVLFDVVGTLFSLDRARRALADEALDPAILELWFARLLHAAMAGTLAGRYVPFKDAAESSLRQVLAARGASDSAVPSVVGSLKELEPWDDARACLSSLRAAGYRLAALTNSGESSANSLLENSGLKDSFEAVFSADAVRACKPHPDPYRFALRQAQTRPEDACLVAAHGWDVMGAAAAGLRTIWISRLERRWPFPGDPPGETVPDLASVPEAAKRALNA